MGFYEFYRFFKVRLKKTGVLLGWVQLHQPCLLRHRVHKMCFYYGNLSCWEGNYLINLAFSCKEFGFFGHFDLSAWILLAIVLAVFSLF